MKAIFYWHNPLPVRLAHWALRTPIRSLGRPATFIEAWQGWGIVRPTKPVVVWDTITCGCCERVTGIADWDPLFTMCKGCAWCQSIPSCETCCHGKCAP